MTNFTFYSNPTLTLVRVPSDDQGFFSFHDLARLTGVHPELLRYYYRRGLIEAHAGGAEDDPLFGQDALSEIRRIEHYRRFLGVNRRALPLLCELRREGERQQIELRFLCGP